MFEYIIKSLAVGIVALTFIFAGVVLVMQWQTTVMIILFWVGLFLFGSGLRYMDHRITKFLKKRRAL